jgi:hypothetical protein
MSDAHVGVSRRFDTRQAADVMRDWIAIVSGHAKRSVARAAYRVGCSQTAVSLLALGYISPGHFRSDRQKNPGPVTYPFLKRTGAPGCSPKLAVPSVQNEQCGAIASCSHFQHCAARSRKMLSWVHCQSVSELLRVHWLSPFLMTKQYFIASTFLRSPETIGTSARIAGAVENVYVRQRRRAANQHVRGRNLVIITHSYCH